MIVYNQTGDDSNPSAPVEDIMKKPDKLHDLDLDAFAVELQRRVKSYTLLHVHSCMHHVLYH